MHFKKSKLASRWLGFVLSAGICSLFPSLSTSEQEHFGTTFGVWHTLCDAKRNCAAYTYVGVPDNPQSGHVFNLEKGPGSDEWAMSLWLDGTCAKASLGIEASVIRYGHDSGPIPHIAADDITVAQDGLDATGFGSCILYLSGANAQTVLERLRPGDVLDFEFSGCDEEFLFATFLLDGVTAALAWIDQEQGRPQGSTNLANDPPDASVTAVAECQ